MVAENIDQVIAELDEIIEVTRAEESRLGYFAALYRKVTIQVGKGIEEDFFDDPARMERLDVVFANRYLDALAQYRQGLETTDSWAVAFAASQQWWPIVLQHLLIGMNAHINLDLGIAAARTAPGQALPGLKNDFDKINEILSSMVDDVERELARVWPLLRLLDKVAGRTDETIIRFSMDRARDDAWAVAQILASLDQVAQAERIAQLDGQVARMGRLLWHPGLLIGTAVRIIRLGERGTVAKIIDKLA